MTPVLLRRCTTPGTPGNPGTTENKDARWPMGWFDRELNRMVNHFWNDENESATYPVDVREDENHLYVDAELPGFKKDEIDITLHDGVLSITGERKAESGDDEVGEGVKTHLSERRFTRVSRSFRLPTDVDPNQVDAKLADGVLHLTLHKSEQVKPRKIAVK